MLVDNFIYVKKSVKLPIYNFSGIITSMIAAWRYHNRYNMCGKNRYDISMAGMITDIIVVK